MIEMTENGETLIKKIQRILDENEPLTDGAHLIYTPKQAGVRDDCNIRTDKWELAMNAMDRVNNYKLNEYLKKGEAEAPKTAEGQTEGGVTEPNPTRDNYSGTITNTICEKGGCKYLYPLFKAKKAQYAYSILYQVNIGSASSKVSAKNVKINYYGIRSKTSRRSNRRINRGCDRRNRINNQWWSRTTRRSIQKKQ